MTHDEFVQRLGKAATQYTPDELWVLEQQIEMLAQMLLVILDTRRRECTEVPASQNCEELSLDT
jgi:hypothetical protein